jgi:hypothetical protein
MESEIIKEGMKKRMRKKKERSQEKNGVRNEWTELECKCVVNKGL